MKDFVNDPDLKFFLIVSFITILVYLFFSPAWF